VTVDAPLVGSGSVAAAEPGRGVVIEGGVEGRGLGDGRPRLRIVGAERRGAAATAGFGAGGLVGAASDSSGSALLDLVGHGVGQGGDGRGGADEVAVAVEKGVEVAQWGGPVPPEDREAGGTQSATTELRGALRDRWQGRPVEVGWADPSAPRDRRVEVVAKVGEGVDDRATLVREIEERVVDPPQAVDEGIAVDLQLEACSRVDARGLPEEQAWRAPGSIGAAVRCDHRWRPRHRDGVGRGGAEVTAAVSTRKPVEG